MKIMKYTSCLISSLILLTFSLISHSDSGAYAGVSYTQIEYSESAGELDFTTVGGILGYNLSSSFGIEARYSNGQSGDSFHGYDFEIDKMASIFGRFSLQNDTNLTPYLLIGWTKGWIDGDFGGDSDSDISYGGGVGFELAKGLSIAAEYVVLIEESDYDFNQLGVNLVYVF